VRANKTENIFGQIMVHSHRTQILSDPTCLRCQSSQNPQKWEVEWQLPGDGGEGKDEKSSGDQW
jgi:hypothetical protein